MIDDNERRREMPFEDERSASVRAPEPDGSRRFRVYEGSARRETRSSRPTRDFREPRASRSAYADERESDSRWGGEIVSLDLVSAWQPSSSSQASSRRFVGVIDDRESDRPRETSTRNGWDDRYDDEYDADERPRGSRGRSLRAAREDRAPMRARAGRTAASARRTSAGKRSLLGTVAAAPGGVLRGVQGVASFALAHAAPFVVLCAVVFTLSQAYGPMRDYYLALRKEQVLAQTLEALEGQNDQLRDDVARLQTKEGIEDEAHRYGYVHQGEVRVVIDDVNENDMDDWKLDATGEVEVTEEREWYIELLDQLFGFDPKEQ